MGSDKKEHEPKAHSDIPKVECPSDRLPWHHRCFYRGSRSTPYMYEHAGFHQDLMHALLQTECMTEGEQENIINNLVSKLRS
jgi:hypothetical protein